MQAFLHHLVCYTDVEESQVIVNYRKSEKFEDCTEMLELHEERGVIDKLIVEKNDGSLRGSDNHKRGLKRCLEHAVFENIIILDCDLLVLGHSWLPNMVKKLRKNAIYGAKQLRRGYVWPVYMAVRKGFIMAHWDKLDKSYEEIGDTLEFLSKETEKKGFVPVHDVVVHNGQDNGLVEYYGKHYAEAVHLGAASRIDSGVDGYSKANVSVAWQYISENLLPEYAMIIPTYGDYHKSIECVMQSGWDYGFKVASVGSGVGVDLESRSTSKSYLMNLGFIHTYAQKYLFQDRDIPLPTNDNEQTWWNAFKNLKQKVALCHNGVWYNGNLEKEAPGGSVLVEHDAFLKIGGFDYNMQGVGLEDREFILRCKKAGYGVGRVDVELHHVEHERRLTYDDYKGNIRKAVLNGSLEMYGRDRYIWNMMRGVK